ncbi:GntR family transcriptional regulator [Saccharopolyspora sp. K220]|uniref:GntR family transcriptional regulator n=1 Tax=Saccharopolyspora soli TaxID=2926618 RepID=UPI001F585A15|nr:GntR family transcriptional regulator [Saccharopolyspora soli]MCI2419326.1 GntR family transcriptional regulator [Saccharopolyspora soli]
MPRPEDGFLTKSEFAYSWLRDRIISHEFPPGEIMNQTQIAKDLGISTTPLREALRRLKSEGLVELDAHRDARATALSAEEARDLMETRLALDPLAAALAAERRSKADIADMRAAADFDALPDRAAMPDLAAHRRFHRSIYRASHNEILISTLDALWDKADRYRLMGLRDRGGSAKADQTAEEHRLLLGAVIAGDADEASAVMTRHIRGSLGAKAAARLARAAAGSRPRDQH